MLCSRWILGDRHSEILDSNFLLLRISAHRDQVMARK